MTGHPVSCPQNVATARGSAQANVMLRMVELTAFSALSLAPLAGVSGRREARELDLASTEPPLCRRGETAHDYASRGWLMVTAVSRPGASKSVSDGCPAP